MPVSLAADLDRPRLGFVEKVWGINWGLLVLVTLIYGVVFVLLVVVEVKGAAKMGAERWIDLGFIQIQPSELMKVSLVLVLARYFNGLTMEEVGKPSRLILPALL